MLVTHAPGCASTPLGLQPTRKERPMSRPASTRHRSAGAGRFAGIAMLGAAEKTGGSRSGSPANKPPLCQLLSQLWHKPFSRVSKDMQLFRSQIVHPLPPGLHTTENGFQAYPARKRALAGRAQSASRPWAPAPQLVAPPLPDQDRRQLGRW